MGVTLRDVNAGVPEDVRSSSMGARHSFLRARSRLGGNRPVREPRRVRMPEVFNRGAAKRTGRPPSPATGGPLGQAPGELQESSRRGSKGELNAACSTIVCPRPANPESSVSSRPVMDNRGWDRSGRRSNLRPPWHFCWTPPDIALLGLEMQVMGGLLLLHRLRDAQPSPPAVIMSGYEPDHPSIASACQTGRYELSEQAVRHRPVHRSHQSALRRATSSAGIREPASGPSPDSK